MDAENLSPTMPPTQKRIELLHFILQNAPAGVIVVDEKMTVTDINALGQKITGYPPQEALGRHCREVFHAALFGQKCPLEMILTAETMLDQQDVLQNSRGEQVPILFSSLAFRDETGVFKGGALIFRDMSPFKLLEEERRHLVNMFTHDLKTPVVGMSGLVKRLIQGKAGPLAPEQRVYLETIDKEMQRLEKLINSFLEFARLDLHILTPIPSAIEVEKECQEVMTLLRPLAEAKSIEMDAEFPQEVLVLPADPLLFRRVLENLLENAIKYSPPHSRIVLEARLHEEEVRFAVTDQGPGIALEELPNLFKFFYRGAEAGKEKGFGLGLATVKRIIDAHGGRIWVKTQPGQGAAFFFTFPMRAQEA